jgi:dTDP-4-amino-4,6-dideoxygalactose transaminase
MIPVTETYLPHLAVYTEYLKVILKRTCITNHVLLVEELEEALKAHLGVKHLFLVANGTITLQSAINTLGLRRQIVTILFSYAATTFSIVWEGCWRIFVDINSYTMCLNSTLLERAITADTTAILATHIYRNLSEVEAIWEPAEKHELKVIYDATQAFGAQYKEQAIVHFGDVYTLSLHAIKLLHPSEGAAIITNDDELAFEISCIIDCGREGPECYWGLGINGKKSEFNVAMGLCLLPKVAGLSVYLQQLSELYDKLLQCYWLAWSVICVETTYNYVYHLVLFADETTVLAVTVAINPQYIFLRCFAFLALKALNYMPVQLAPVAQSVASRVLCLPLAHDLLVATVQQTAAIIITCL